MWGIANFVNVAGVEQSNNVKELHHWRAHERGLSSLDWIERKSLLLSASLDTQAPSLNPNPDPNPNPYPNPNPNPNPPPRSTRRRRTHTRP